MQSKSGITIRPVVADQLDKFIGTFPGPEGMSICTPSSSFEDAQARELTLLFWTGTPYEGGTFEVEMEAPDKYPFAPLKMKFITKVRACGEVARPASEADRELRLSISGSSRRCITRVRCFAL